MSFFYHNTAFPVEGQGHTLTGMPVRNLGFTETLFILVLVNTIRGLMANVLCGLSEAGCLGGLGQGFIEENTAPSL